jgi:outer membrane protein assembly factor BamB
MACFRVKNWQQGGWSLVLLLGSVNAGCSRYKPVPRVDLSPTMDPVQVEGAPLEEVWSRRAGRGLGGAISHSDTVMYVGAADRHVMAIDLRNGVQRWSARLSGPVAEGVVSDDRMVYVHTERPDGRAYGLDKISGSRKWEVTIGLAAAPPALIEGSLIVANRNGMVLALNPANGEIKWRRKVGVARVPAFAGSQGSVIVATLDSLFQLSGSDGRVLQRRKNTGPMLSPWVSQGAYRIAGTADSQVVAINAESFTPAWSVRLDAPVIGSPILRGDTVYALTRIGSLYRIPISPAPVAERLASARTPFLTSPVLVRDWIVAGSADGVLFGFTLEGQIAWRVLIAGPIELAPLVLADGFLAFGGRGDLHRYRI